MDCPNGHGPMITGKKGWICEDCDYKAAYPVTDLSAATLASLLDRLPSPVAIPWRGFLDEKNPVLRLYRLCDAAEVTVRFLTVIALGEARRGSGNAPLPDDLLQRLQPNIERPTFGGWWAMLGALSATLKDRSDLVISTLPDFIKEPLVPMLDGLDGKDEHHSLIALRNNIYHSGGTPLATAQRFLDEWTPRAESLLGALAFLEDTELRFVHGNQSYPLTGPLPPIGPGGAGRVTLHRGDEAIDLWPLCDYGPVLPDPNAAHPKTMPSGPRVFLRAERDRLLFAALGVDPWQGESRESLTGFRALFRLDQRTSQPVPDAPADFEQEIRADADALIGRRDALSLAKTVIGRAPGGVLWISGPGGMGKSFLMARLAADYGNDPQKICRLVWRFRAGDAARCSRLAFLRYAVKRLSQWKPLQTQDDAPPTTDPAVLHRQLAELLARAAALPAPAPRAKPPRVLFFLDGMDEIERIDPGFSQLPFDLVRENAVWVCAGRPEGTLPDIFAESRCAHVFRGGLPLMNDNDVRAMLLEETGPFKYALLAQDSAEADAEGRIVNPTAEAVVLRAHGLPLYVRHVIADVLSGHFRFQDLAGKLPAGLIGYYDDLLRRLGVGDLQALLTPLVSTLAWAMAPLNEESLHLLMVRRKSLREGETGRATLRRGLQALQAMIRVASSPDGDYGYELNHLTFREHVRRAEALSNANATTQDELCQLAVGWEELSSEHPARRYALEFGPQHLHDARWLDALYALARSEAFLQDQSAALTQDPDALLRTLRLALQGAMEQDDAAKMGEFVIAHGRRLQSITKEMPLSALRNGSMERAWKLADLYETEKRVLWHLLLAWELKDAGREADWKSTLERLVVKDLPQLTNRWISDLLILAASPDEPTFTSLSQKLADEDDHYVLVCQHLAAAGDVASALQCAQLVQDTGQRMDALQAVVAAQAAAHDFDGARKTMETFSTEYPGKAIDALISVVAIASKAGNEQEFPWIFDFADWLLHRNADDWQEWFNNTLEGKVALARASVGHQNAEDRLTAAIFDGTRTTYSGKFEKAAKAAQKLNTVESRIGALIQISLAAAKGEDKRQAREIFDLARDAAKSITPVEHLKFRDAVGNTADALKRKKECFRDIAQAEIRIGMTEEGLATQEEALETIRMTERLTRDNCEIFPESFVELKTNLVRAAVGRVLAETGKFEAALDVARQINSGKLLVSTLCRLASSQAEAGDVAQSNETFAEAIRTAHRPAEDTISRREELLADIALAQSEAGDGSSARETFAEAIQGGPETDEAEIASRVIAGIAQIQMKSSNLLVAVQTARRAVGEPRDRTLAEIVRALVKNGQIVEAREVVADIIDQDEKDTSLGCIAWGLIELGELNEVFGTLQEIQDFKLKDSRLRDLAEAYTDQGDLQQANEAASLIQDDEEKMQVQESIGAAKLPHEELPEANPHEVAKDGIQKPLSVSEIRLIRRRDEQSFEYWRLASHLITSGRPLKGVEATHAAIRSILQYNNSYEAFDLIVKRDVMRDVLIGLSSVNLLEEITSLLRRLPQEFASQIWPGEEAIEDSAFCNSAMRNDYVLIMLKEAARAHARRGQFEQALQIVEMDDEFWHQAAVDADINIHQYRADALCEIASAYAESGHRQEARQTLEIARDCANKIQPTVRFVTQRVSELYRVAINQAKYGFGKAALKTSELIIDEGTCQALEDTRLEFDFYEENVSLPNIAWYFAINGDTANFKWFLPPCADSRETAYEMCRQLAQLYPDQADRIVDMICTISLSTPSEAE